MFIQPVIVLLLAVALQLPAQQPEPPAPPLSLQQGKVWAEQSEKFSDLVVSVRTLAGLAVLLKDADKVLARELIVRAWSRIKSSQAEAAQKLRATKLLAGRAASIDSSLADEILEKGIAELSDKEKGNTYLDQAYRLIESNPERASTLIEQGVKLTQPSSVPYLLLQLRKTDAARADALFLQSLARLSAAPQPDAELLLDLGFYLYSFYPPGSKDEMVSASVGVGTTAVVALIYERPEATLESRMAFLTTAVGILTRNVTEPRARVKYAAAGNQLLPRVRQYLPDAAPKLQAAMEQLRQNVPNELYDQQQYERMKDAFVPLPAEDILARLDLPASDLARNADCVVMTQVAHSASNYELMKKIAGKARDQNLRSSIRKLAEFYLLKKELDAERLITIREIRASLSPGLERVAALLLLAKAAQEKGDPILQREAALLAAKEKDDCPYDFQLSVLAATLNWLNCEDARAVLPALIQALDEGNSLKPLSVALEAGPVNRHFSLLEATTLAKAFQTLVACDAQLVIDSLERIKNEEKKGEAILAVVEALMKKEKKTA